MPTSRSRRVAPRTPPRPPGPANPLLPHPVRAPKSPDRLPGPTPPEHQPRRRANGGRRPDRQAGATASSAGRGRCARDTPQPAAVTPGFGGLPLLHPQAAEVLRNGGVVEKAQAARPHPSPQIERLRRTQHPRHRGMASPCVPLERRCLSLRSSGVRARRADGAKTRSKVLSELAQGNVSVEWERTDVAPGVLEGRPDPRHAAARPQ